MKATGIVRRIDDLGRVVIPKEIRRTMHIKEGAPLEIFTDTEGGVIFKKYSPISEISDVTEHFADVLYRSVTTPVLICDRDHVISCAGVSKKDFLEKRISAELESVMESRQLYTGDRDKQLFPIEGIDYGASIAMPIIGNGDILGAVVFLWSDGSKISPTDKAGSGSSVVYRQANGAITKAISHASIVRYCPRKRVLTVWFQARFNYFYVEKY